MRNSLILCLILVLALFMAYIPHIGYPYPLHLDEWTHLTYAEAIEKSGSLTFADPFTGDGTVGPGNNIWIGFHVWLAVLQQITGIDWMPLFRFFPGIIFMFTVLSVYIFARRQGYGLEAAFFTCLIPTTVGLLGPAFMVPMALGLFFIPVSLFLVFNIKSWPSYILLFLILCFLWLMHPPTAAILTIILTPCILIDIQDKPWHNLYLLSTLLLPFALAIPWIVKPLMQYGRKLLIAHGSYPPQSLEVPPLLWIFGILPIAFGFLGIIALVKRGGRRNIGLIFGLVLLLVIMAIFLRLQYGLQPIYERGLTTVLLLIAIIAGAGLFSVRTFKVPVGLMPKYEHIVKINFGNALCMVAVIVIILSAIPSRLEATYYHVIDAQDYESYIWTRDHIDENYTRALIDPWKATAFIAITGKNVARRIWGYKEPVDDIIYQKLSSGCENTNFLQENRISFVINKHQCTNSDLIEVRKDIYLTNPNITNTFNSEDGLQNGGFEAVDGNPPAHWYQWSRNCTPNFLFPVEGRDSGECVGIKISTLNPSGLRQESWWGQEVNVSEGHPYTVGGWVKTENIVGAGGARLVVNWNDSYGKWIGATGFMKYTQGTTGWTYHIGRVVAPAGAVTFTVCCEIADCTGTAWYDDIFFQAE